MENSDAAENTAFNEPMTGHHNEKCCRKLKMLPFFLRVGNAIKPVNIVFVAVVAVVAVVSSIDL